MSRHLITPSLLSSYQYYISDEWENPYDSRAGFLRTLSKEEFLANEAIQKGIDFENDIFDACNQKCIANHSKIEPRFVELILDNGVILTKDMKDRAVMFQYIECVENVANIVKGGLWQQSVKKELKVGNREFLLYGRTDVIKRDTIFDIKFTSNYEAGKFVSSSQHRIYLYCTGLPKFQYLVSDGREYWTEDYHNHAKIEDELRGMINDFMGYLENDREAKEMFLTRWEVK